MLPFRNTSGDAQDDYFADGVTEAITTDLASISALRVISRQSVTRFRRSEVPVPEIARVLGVDALIGGAVARGGGRIRVTVQLVHGATDRLKPTSATSATCWRCRASWRGPWRPRFACG